MKSARLTDKLKEGVSVEGAAACEVMIECPGADVQLWLESGGRAPCRSYLGSGDACSLEGVRPLIKQHLQESLFKS